MQKESLPKLTFTRISKSNIDELSKGLSELYSKSANPSYRDPSYWRWCYNENPLGKSNCIVATRNGRIMGKFGNIYLKMSVQRKRVVARLMEGLYIEPDERSWRCYAGLMEKSHLETSKDNIAFGFAISTPDAEKLSLRTGAISLGRAPLYIGFISIERLLLGLPLPRFLSLAGWLVQPLLNLKTAKVDISDQDIRPIETFDDSFDRLWENIEQNRTLSLVKDADFLNWRYVRCPNRKYSRFAAYDKGYLKGFIVLRTTSSKRDGFIFELQALDDDKNAMKALLAYGIEKMGEQGVGLVSASFPVDSPQAKALKELGFNTWGTRLWNMKIVVSTDSNRDSSPELDLKNWSFSLGDWLYYLNPGTWY